MAQLGKLGLFGGAAFAGLASLALQGYAICFPRTLIEGAYEGDSLEIRLSPDACAGPLANTDLTCDYPYVGRRLYYARNLWEFTGPKKGSPAPMLDGGINAPDERGVLSLWGILARFDETGRLTTNGKEIGTVKLTTRP
jgi:hypothetical protein